MRLAIDSNVGMARLLMLSVFTCLLVVSTTIASDPREFLIVQSFEGGRFVVQSTADAVLNLDVGSVPVVYSTDEYVGTSSLAGFVRLWDEERPSEEKAVEAVLEVRDPQIGTAIPLAVKAVSIQGTTVVYQVGLLGRYPSWHEQAREPWVAASPRQPGDEVAFGSGVLLLRFRSNQLTSLIFGK